MRFSALSPIHRAQIGQMMANICLSRRSTTTGRLLGTGLIALSLSFKAASAPAAEDTSRDTDAPTLRAYITKQVGGLQKLRVPAHNEDLPVPRQPDGTVNYRYETTEAKHYLGKLIFHDPARTVRIDKNLGQPVDLPVGTGFGGTVKASDPMIAGIVKAERQTGSCGSCHLGEAAGKAGQTLNFNVGGEGRGYTDQNGNFIPRRRPRSILTRQRSAPIFQGDALVDAIPTLNDVDLIGQKSNAHIVVTNPSAFYHQPNPTALLATGRLDELDSVARLSPSLVGAAFNNRLLLGGFAGEPTSAPGSLNPYSDPAQENLTLLLLDAHRMLNFESAVLQKIPAFVQLFKDAFPTEAALARSDHNMDDLINDQTVFRATATFLRTIVTRNTPFDRFLAGNDQALTAKQRRGAYLFFTPAAGEAGGAGCFSCHSGPMLNKQTNDPDVTGMGSFVEENFFNVGIGDHPVQVLNAVLKGHFDPKRLGADGFPYHSEDNGRAEITQDQGDTFKFRTLTLRQLKDGRNFFHNASFTSVRDVVQYFNDGIPQDPIAGVSSTLSERFVYPRGPGYPRGIGLTKRQVDDITDFLENGLYDPALVKYDPSSTTDTLQPNVHDLTYSKYRPDLSALGAKDGFVLSGLATDDNDPLARRDEGLDFEDVRNQTVISPLGENAYRITNVGLAPIDTNLLVIVSGLPRNMPLLDASGTTTGGDPYIRLYLKDGVLDPGGNVLVKLLLPDQHARLNYKLTLLSGQGAQVALP